MSYKPWTLSLPVNISNDCAVLSTSDRASKWSACKLNDVCSPIVTSTAYWLIKHTTQNWKEFFFSQTQIGRKINLAKIAPLDFWEFDQVIFSRLLYFSVAKRHGKANTLQQARSYYYNDKHGTKLKNKLNRDQYLEQMFQSHDPDPIIYQAMVDKWLY